MSCFILDPNDALDWGHPLNNGRVGLWFVPPNKESNQLWDFCRNRYQGSIVSGPTRTIMGPGGRIKAINFNGSSDYYTTSFVLNANGSYTLSQWIKTTTTAFDIPHGLSTASGTDGVWVGLNYAGNKVTFNTASSKLFSASTTVNDDKWHHILCTKNGTACTIFVDGISVATATKNGTVAAVTHRIGNFQVATTYAYLGQIASTSIWNRALSDSEVWQEYDTSRRDYCTPNSPLKWAELDNEEWMEEVAAASGPVMPIFRQHYVNQGIQ